MSYGGLPLDLDLSRAVRVKRIYVSTSERPLIDVLIRGVFQASGCPLNVFTR